MEKFPNTCSAHRGILSFNDSRMLALGYSIAATKEHKEHKRIIVEWALLPVQMSEIV